MGKWYLGRGFKFNALIRIGILVAFASLIGGWHDWAAASGGSSLSVSTPLAQDVSQFGNIPAFFTENQGQTAKEVKYYFKGNDNIYFTDNGVMFQEIVKRQDSGDREQGLNNPPLSPFDKGGIKGGLTQDSKLETRDSLAYKLEFIGARLTSPQARNELKGKVNYLIGNDRSKWHSNIPTYQEIVYPGLYSPCHYERSEESHPSGGIDLAYIGVPGGMKYEFVVQPGANPDDIRLAYTRIEALSIDDTGNLIIHTALGDVKDTKPYCYQEIDGKQMDVRCNFVIMECSDHVAVDTHPQPLLLEPVQKVPKRDFYIQYIVFYSSISTIYCIEKNLPFCTHSREGIKGCVCPCHMKGD